jgi:hypothetical protein
VSYTKGTLVNCRATFTDPVSGSVVDPTTVTFRVKNPSGITTTWTYGPDLELEKESTGHYKAQVNANQQGSWSYRFESTGPYQGAREATFDVEGGAF